MCDTRTIIRDRHQDVSAGLDCLCNGGGLYTERSRNACLSNFSYKVAKGERFHDINSEPMNAEILDDGYF